MEARAVVRHVRMSPRKMRVVANLVRGKRVDEAMAMLKLMPKKGAAVIRKLLNSAVANAEQAGINDVDQLIDPRLQRRRRADPQAVDAARDGPRQPQSTSAPATSPCRVVEEE